MTTGTVKWFNAEKGYGFIQRDDGAGDLFCHSAELFACDALTTGERVQFKIGADRRGRKQAVDVSPAPKA